MTIKLERITGQLSKINTPRGTMIVINTDVYTDLEIEVLGGWDEHGQMFEGLVGNTITAEGRMHEGYFMIYKFSTEVTHDFQAKVAP